MENALTAITENAFQIMDRMDDEIIEAELKNRVVNTWAYSFSGSDGKQQEGLSKVGVDEACVEMSKRGYIIREGKIAWERDPTNPEYILFQVPASLIRITTEGQEVLMDVVNGTKRQWIKMKRRDKTIMDDPFWFEKGAMKASRNARSRLIPSETKAKILVLARQGNKTKKIVPTESSPIKPPDDPQSENLRGAMDEVLPKQDAPDEAKLKKQNEKFIDCPKLGKQILKNACAHCEGYPDILCPKGTNP